MGQKVSPKAFRLKFNQYWDSLWFSDKQYGKQLIEDIQIRQMIGDKLKIASVAKVIIDRNANQITVSIYSSKPGVLIGRSGAGSEKIKEMLEKITKSKVKLNIVEIKKSDVNAMNVAQNVAAQIEKRIPFRRVIKQAIDHAKESGIKGIKVQVSGRLNGADIARSEKATFGTVPLSTLKSNVDYANTTALTTYGIIGIKVWVYLGKKDFLFEENNKNTQG